MTPDDWQRIEALFTDAVRLQPGERASFLETTCPDARIRRQVSLMLIAEGQSGPIEAESAGTPLGPELRRGDRIGPWRVIRPVGRGGMGAVFLCERADGEFRQQAAVKVMNIALANARAVERFAFERQVLASLQHPNIAQLLDGGTTDDGVPYLAMSFIDGQRIDQYCDSQRLAIRARLRLFRDVCGAVHAAHRRLVVHRDIKPGNVLVTEDGVPKLLDFGIAKLLDPDESLDLTQVGVRPMTPEYASPEQVLGEPITTASDVYSLGVLLYELLSGHLPHDLPDGNRPGIARAICDIEPPKPSTRIQRLPGGSTVFDRRRSTPARLRRRLAGDLDNIVMMALRKEPERRYPSALRMAEDIDLHLADRPVVARSNTLGYRLAKYARRNTVAVATCAVTLLAIVSVATLSTVRLAKERDRAQEEATRAAQTSEFLRDLFRVVDPARTEGERVTARELLDHGARRLDKSLSNQPATRASLQATIGQVYLRLGLFNDARPLLQNSLEVQRTLYGATDPATVPTMLNVAETSEQLGSFEEAERLIDEAIGIAQREHGRVHALTARALRVRGVVQESAGKYTEAAASLREALQILESLDQTDRPDYARALTILALCYDQLGDYDAALPLLEQAFQRHQDAFGALHPLTTEALHALAVAQDRLHQYDAAEPSFMRALANAQRLYGDAHPMVGEIQGNIGRLYSHMGRQEESRHYYELTLATTRSVFGDRHYYVGYDLVALGRSSALAGDLTEAESYFVQALDVYSESLPEAHPYVAAGLITYARLLLDLDRLDEALSLARRARAAAVEALSEEHWLTAQTDVVIGVIYARTDQGDPLPLLTSGFERLLAASGRQHAATQFALRQLLEELQRRGDDDAYARYAVYRGAADES